MQVDRQHGRCRACGGTLDIVDADDATMTVECEDGHCYAVEPDAFGDGCRGRFVAGCRDRGAS